MVNPILSKIRIRPLLLGCFVLVALIPITIISINTYRAAWLDAWREIREKHQLLAENLASPIAIYVANHQEMLRMLAQRLQEYDLHDEVKIRSVLQQTLDQVTGFKALMLINPEGSLQYCIDRHGKEQRKIDLTKVAFFNHIPKNRIAVSSIVKSPISQKPAIFITVNMGGDSNVLVGASLRIEHIDKLRKQIRFGKQGHSAIIDDRGRVIAHPNAAWMEAITDLSELSIVKRMMAGGTGVTEFFSPYIKQDMVAGYTQIPGLGWGVMVPQPRSEVRAQVIHIMNHYLLWGAVSLIMAVTAAGLIARGITKPINELAASATKMLRSNFRKSMPLVSNGPKEIVLMGSALNEAVNGLVQSRREFEELNESLQIRVEKATAELRAANEKLEVLASSDYLTKLANRRYFETFFNSTLKRREVDPKPFVLLLLDVDKFKSINDMFGHGAGDAVLSRIAGELQSHVRENDLVARYGGDEFIALMDAEKQVALQRAKQISVAVEKYIFEQNDKTFTITVSIGLLYIDGMLGMSRDELFAKVDDAMYTAKKRGRNTIVEVSTC